MNAGNTAFVLICACLVMIMTPGLAFFYGGLGRRKNVLNTMMMSLFIMGMASVLWIAFGYSVSFCGDHGGVIGTMHQAFMHDMFKGTSNYAPSIPKMAYVVFQMMFAMITPALITGAVAGRMNFKAIFFFILFWLILVYFPLAHMVWGAGGLIGSKLHALDFAGGDVVHISSGFSGLLLALMIGRRQGYNRVSYHTHNIPFVVLGAALLWFGWYGFNGAAAKDTGTLASIFLTTTLAPAIATVVTMIFTWVKDGKPDVSMSLNASLAGLVAITASCDCTDALGSIIIGIVSGILVVLAVEFIDKKLFIDDPVGACAVHLANGIWGTFAVGLFSTGANGVAKGLFYGGGFKQLGIQAIGFLAITVWTAATMLIV